MIPTEEESSVAVLAFEEAMHRESWDGEPKMAALYIDALTGEITARDVPGFNRAIEFSPLSLVMAGLARLFRQPGGALAAAEMVRGPAHGGEFIGVAVGVEGFSRDTGNPDDMRTVVGLDTAGRVVLVTREGGGDPVLELAGPSAGQPIGGKLFEHLRDIMLSLCAAMPDEQSDIVAVSRVVQVKSEKPLAFGGLP